MTDVALVDDAPVRGVPPVGRRRSGLGGAVVALVWRRLWTGALLLLGLAVLVFLAVEALPGDVVSSALGRSVTPQQADQLRQELGLDGSWSERFGSWMAAMVRGDLGESLARRQPVADVALGRLGNTLVLAAVAFAGIVPLALAVGVVSGSRPGSVTDHVLSSSTLALISAPEFVIGTLLAYVIGVRLGWAPPVSLVQGSVLNRPEVLLLPATTMAVVNVGFASRIIRSTVAAGLNSDRAQMARLNGVAETEVVLRHVLRPSLAPAIQVFALIFVFLFASSLVVETVFQYPGVGLLLTESASTRDVTVVQSLTVLLAAGYLLTSLVADVLVVVVTPRLWTAR